MVKSIIKRLYIFFRCIYRKDCKFESGVEFGRTCIFEGNNYLSRNTYLCNVKMGYGSYTGIGCCISETEIGRYTCIGPNVTFAIGRHPTCKYVSQHPAFYSINSPIGFSFVKDNKYTEVRYPQKYKNTKKYAVVVGNDVWIGANAIIFDGVTISDGAIIAAGSVVNQDVKPYSIVGGVPAKELKKRFDQDKIEDLLKTKWWEKEISEIRDIAEDFDNIDVFLQKQKKG